jgi:peptidoglycan/LPS O-acetylase OafA/YrhL
MTTARSASYRPALDGIRALSVVAVMLYHGLVGWSPGGFLGVDVFFVLSGYLITSLLLREWDRWGSLDIVTFYRRRARRLLPALLLLLGAVAVWAAVVAAPNKLGRIRWDGISTLLYTANWRYVFAQQSYFDKYGDPSPFLHTWSLAIEEQFYLLFPLILVGLLRLTRGRRARVGAILALGALASALLMAWLFDPAADPSRVYYGTDTRAQELLIGAVLALALLKMRPLEGRQLMAAAWAGVVALVGVVAAFVLLNDQDAALYRGGFALFCVLVALLLFSVEMVTQGPAAWLLSLRPVAWVGLISYGLYLWHWPVYVALTSDRIGLEGTSLLLVRIGVTFAIALASFYLVERPIRAGGLRRLRRPWGRTVAAIGMPLAFVALVVATLGSRPPPLPDSPFATTAVRGSGDNSLLVVGDSVGLSLTVGFPAKTFPAWSVAASVHLGCGLAEQHLAFDGTAGRPNHECDNILRVWGDAAAKAKPRAVVMVIGSWEVFDHVVDGKVLPARSEGYAEYLRDRLEKARDVLTAHGAQLLLTNVPCYHQASSSPGGHDLAPDRNDRKRAVAVNRVLTDFADAHPDDTTVLDLDVYLCPGGQFTKEKGGVELRPDGVHFSTEGARLAWQWLMPQVEQHDPVAP